jgi:2-C-methyl-D-erythritol 4-phosphate cytidylyltransferase
MTAAAVVILAAGSGSRVGAPTNKVLLPLGDDAVVAWSVRAALAVADVRRVLLVVREGEQDQVAEALARADLDDPRIDYVVGGETRHDSERRALQALSREIDAGGVTVVAIHDAARPWADTALFTSVISAAARGGGAVPVLDLDCVVAKDGSALPERLVGVQTPQAFSAAALLAAYAAAGRDGFAGTDTAACVERYAPDLAVAAVPGPPGNRKITFAADLPTPPDRPTS